MKLSGLFSVSILREMPKVNAQQKVRHCKSELPSAGLASFIIKEEERRNGKEILLFCLMHFKLI